MLDNNEKYKGIVAWFVYNPVATNLLMFSLILIGVFSFIQVEKSLLPEFNSSSIQIQAVYPGASPTEVENGVIFKIEEAIQERNIVGIQQVESKAQESLATISIEVDGDSDIDKVASEVKIALDSVDSFPKDVENPYIEKRVQNIPVMNVQIYGSGLDELQMKKLANQIKNEFIAAGVSKVVFYGNRDSQIAIEVSEDTLRKYNLTLNQIAQSISAHSIDLPAGKLSSERGDIALRAVGKAESISEFNNIPVVTTTDGRRILLREIANVKEDFEDITSRNTFDNKRSIGMGIFAVSGEDFLEISKIAKEYVQEKQQEMPANISIAYWGETDKLLEGRLNMMYSNLAIGTLLVFIVLSLFMNFPIAFWVMVGIPVCFLGTYFLLPFAGVTINMISLFGFILVLGIVVDDAIIIGESVHTYISKEGVQTENTVIRGVKRVATPAIFGVLTTMCAFLPTIFTSGKWANFPAACGYVVLFSLLFSIIESKLILPAHLAHGNSFTRLLDIKWQDRLQQAVNKKLQNFIDTKYRPFLHIALKNRYVTASVFIAALVMIISLLMGGYIRYIMSPDVPSDYIRASLSMPRGTPEASVEKAQKDIIAALYRVDEKYKEEHGHSFIKHKFEYLISTSSRTTIELVHTDKIKTTPREISEQWEKEVGTIIGAKTFIISDAQEDDVGIAAAIAYKISAENAEQLYAISKEIAGILKQYDGIQSVTDGVPENMDEIQFKLKPNAESLGVSFASIATQVREAFHGAEAQRLQREDEELRVRVRYPKEERVSLSNFNELYIRTNSGERVPLQTVADFEIKPAKVEKTRINGKPALILQAKVDKLRVEPQKVSTDLELNVFPKLKEKYPSFKFSLAGGTKDDQTMERELFIGFILALIGIYALLAIPLGSYTQPLIIMSVIPFGVIGAILGHIFMGLTVSMMSIFGIIALAGVVVNDSLIFVDFINDARKKGVGKHASIVQAGGERFRAIMITSLTTFFGIMPILMETDLQAQFVIPMATSLGFGIIFATVITLVLVPCLYLILNDLSIMKNKLLGNSQLSEDETPETVIAS